MYKRQSKAQVQIAFDYLRNSARSAGVNPDRWVLDHQTGGWRVTNGDGGRGLFAGPRLQAYWFILVCEAAGDAFNAAVNKHP